MTIFMVMKKCNPSDICGQEFGRLTIVGISCTDKYNKAIYRCRCDCGQFKLVRRYDLLGGKVKSCGCLRKELTAERGRRTVKKNNLVNRKFVGNLSGQFWARVKQSAKLRNIPFEITQEEAWSLFERQGGNCALTGQLLILSPYHKDRKTNTASIDRIDSSNGYVIGNVQWIHKDVNFMKQEFSQPYFLRLCHMVVNHQLK